MTFKVFVNYARHLLMMAKICHQQNMSPTADWSPFCHCDENQINQFIKKKGLFGLMVDARACGNEDKERSYGGVESFTQWPKVKEKGGKS